MPFVRALLIAVIFSATVGCHGSASSLSKKAFLADQYLDLITTYSIYAKTLWHEDPAGAGGYWGDGIAAAEHSNGAVRGMCNTMLGYAMLIHAQDRGWLELKGKGSRALVLSREELLHYIELNLDHILAHHKSAPHPLEPQWGLSWQSSLWVGAAGCAVMLVEKDLPNDLRERFDAMTAAEADRIAHKPPKNYLPGDTGAEENGWDTHALAIALVLMPNHPHHDDWWRTITSYAVNTYSVPADKTSDAMVGSDRVRDIVTTANCFSDFTLENHKIFHPDYVQVSGQELGEAWIFLQLGDKLHGTHLGEQFKPYAMHHVADVWQHVMRPLLMSDGEWAFPNGTDWTYHCSMTPSYLAFIATALGDPAAIEGERLHMRHVMRRRDLSPPGRILGDSNLEWWWEPLITKRSCTALLQHELRTPPPAMPGTKHAPDPFLTSHWPDAKAWLFRNSEYCITLAWGAKHMATLTSLRDPAHPYLTVPVDGILPTEVSGFIGDEQIGDAHVASLKLNDGRRVAIVCLPQSVVLLSSIPFRPMGIENDPMSGGERIIWHVGQSEEFPLNILALKKQPPMDLPGKWINISDRIGLISSGSGFVYTATDKYTQKGVAADRVGPKDAGAWQIVPQVDRRQTAKLAEGFSTTSDGEIIDATVADGVFGRTYRIKADVSNGASGLGIEVR